jgi:O-antigen/teichoic acid export membrane protein
MLFKKFSYSIITRGLVAIINFLILIVSSRYLGVETRGEISLLILNIANLQMISEIFTGYALVHFIPKFSLKKIVSYGLMWIIVVTILGTLLLKYFNLLIKNFDVEFGIVCLMVILNTFCMVIVLGKENIRWYNWLSIMQPLILAGVLSFDIFVEKKVTLDAYFDALFYSFGFALILNLYLVLKYFSQDKNIDFQLTKIISNGFLSQWSNWMNLLSNRFSYYVLSAVALQSLGIYSTATSLIESVFVIYSGISTVVLSYVSNENDKEKAKRLTIQAATGSFILTILAVLILLAIPESFLIWILGKGFTGIKFPMIILSFGVIMISYSAVFSHYFSGIGVLKFNAISNTIACLFTILLSSIFIQKWSVSGAAMVATISYTIQCILIVYFFMKREKISPMDILDFSFIKNGIRLKF